MSARQQPTIAVLMLFVITPRGSITVHASQDTRKMDVTVQVGILVFVIFVCYQNIIIFIFCLNLLRTAVISCMLTKGGRVQTLCKGNVVCNNMHQVIV